MSRSNYNDDYDDQWAAICWRGAVAQAIRGKRGQALLKEMALALDAMPEKRLIAHELVADGEVCALGTVGVARGLDMSGLDPEEPEAVAAAFQVATALVREIAYENDEGYWQANWGDKETPEHRWQRMRDWVASRVSP